MILGINSAPGQLGLNDILRTYSLEASNHRYRWFFDVFMLCCYA
ncbi:MAG TPA: hypothetical protein PKK64_13565 [Saprospiraceae bacterium]|nr:hypothetical protein [Saprospiraceae bacterium]HMX89617.1 hypothetical protein [Saprospiraceae bacterium]HMZ40693.1 hypothetical protein [Saprospiraceae bacterium]HNB32089.1 hypothetical protein [Saprospiraceae bacterium]HNC36944.1 hypothetical protein [Saprospiraceae bacterium]